MTTGPGGTEWDAVRAAYDTVAADYAAALRDDLAGRPLDRAVLDAFAESVDGPVLDAGCGPGRITAHLAGRGLDVVGLDLSPGMLAVARAAHPDLEFRLGSMAELAVPAGRLGGIVAWYSIIHTPAELLPATFAEFARVLAPGGRVLVAFQVGDERRQIHDAYGHEVSLAAYRRSPDQVAGLLRDAGLPVHARLVREPEAGEKVPQAFLLARRA